MRLMRLLNETNEALKFEISGLKVYFKGRLYTILMRKYNLNKKSKYYLFDVVNKVFLSSLYQTEDKDTFIFDELSRDKRFRDIYKIKFFERDGLKTYQIDFLSREETKKNDDTH